MPEKRNMLKVLGDGNAALYRQALGLVEAWEFRKRFDETQGSDEQLGLS